MFVEKYGWAIQKSFFAETNQDSTFSHTRKNSKMFNITSRYFSFFNNKPPASWVALITRDFLTCYSCSYYSSVVIMSKQSGRVENFQVIAQFISNRSPKPYVTQCYTYFWRGQIFIFQSLKNFVAMRCSTLYFVGRQFVSLNSLAPIWYLELSFKQKRIHLRKLILSIYGLIFLRDFAAMDSPLKLESRQHPRYSTIRYCFILLLLHVMLSLVKFLSLLKSMYFVSSSPKWR